MPWHRQRSGLDQCGRRDPAIEVQVIDNGSGKITVTGSLGDVMKESAQLAVTWVRVHALEYGIDPERLKKCDLHIHAPECSPQRRPLCRRHPDHGLISCLSGIPVRGDVAMTGEITLHGNVLPIGGLREKSMAAYREGMKTVLIPRTTCPICTRWTTRSRRTSSSCPCPTCRRSSPQPSSSPRRCLRATPAPGR